MKVAVQGPDEYYVYIHTCSCLLQGYDPYSATSVRLSTATILKNLNVKYSQFFYFEVFICSYCSITHNTGPHNWLHMERMRNEGLIPRFSSFSVAGESARL
jgi:hypothetical protein